MLAGYVGHLLRVDLSTGKASREGLPGEGVLRDYLGGVGLAVKLLCEEVPPQVGPLDPENRLILMTGPLTGTPVPSSSNCCIVSVNADTGFTVGAAYTHGLFGASLKFAGYDGIIVQGAADRPVYLWLHDGEAEIRDAASMWGKDTHETEDLVRKDIGEARASVACIGPAGENLIGGACIENDKYHIAAFGGTGAVMGSKRLKAIAVYGRGSIPIARPRELVQRAQEWRHKLAAQGFALQNGGMTRTWTSLGKASVLACKNLLKPSLGLEISQKFVEACRGYKVVPKPCLGCPIACSYKVVVTSGPRQGFVGTMAGGAESMEGAAAMAGVDDPASILWLTDHYDRLGLNSCTIGCAVSLAVECYERGLLTKEDTDGLELRWGNTEAIAKLVDKVVAREGFGRVLAEGPKKAAERIGGDAPKYAVHMKGVGFRIHDHRRSWRAMLAQAVSGAGPRGEQSMLEYGPPVFSPEGIAQEARDRQRARLFEDSVGVCMFAFGIPEPLAMENAAIAAATGWKEFTMEEMLALGERIANMERVFNVRRGLTPRHDLDVSPRALEPPADGVAQGQTVAPYLEDAVRKYYRLMGWDPHTGKPLRETLARLGLETMANLL